MKKLSVQIIKFGAVGGICFFVDYLILIALVEFLKVNPLLASAIAFSLSTVVNYILNVLFVFNIDRNRNKTRDFLLFVVISLLGLGLNQVIMSVAIKKIGIFYMAAKIISAIIVLVFNFFAKRFILEGNKGKFNG